MSENIAASWFFPPGDGNKPLANSTGSTSFTEATTRVVVHGQPCKVCETNLVLIDFPFGGSVSGTIKLTTIDASSEHWVMVATQHVSVVESGEDGLTVFTAQATPWVDRPVNEQSLSQPWPSAGPWAQNGLWPTRTRWFVEQTLSSSLSGDTFVSTLSFSGLFIAYAAADWVACGYKGGAIFSGAQVVTHWTSAANSVDYLDARPLQCPKFRVDVTHGPSSGTFASATTNMRVNGGQSVRVGRLDKTYSPLLATGPSRALPKCDNNFQSLKQRRVSDAIYGDSSFFRYGTTLKVDWSGNSDRGPIGGFLGNYTRAFDFQRNFPTSFGDPARLVGSANMDWSIPFAGDFANRTPTLELKQTLHDGRNSSPHEWHFWGDWNESDGVYDFPPAQGNTYQGTLGPYANQATASEVADSITNYPLGSVFYGSMEARRRPRKIQARVFVAWPGGFAGGPVVYFDVRYTWLLEVVFRRQALQVANVQISQQQITGFWFVGYTYFVNDAVQVGCTHKYLGELQRNISALFTKSQWETVVMTGGRATAATSSGGNLGVQFL